MRPDCDVYGYWPRASKPFKLIIDRIGDIIQGNINPLELLMEGNALRDFYGNLSVRVYWDGFFRCSVIRIRLFEYWKLVREPAPLPSWS